MGKLNTAEPSSSVESIYLASFVKDEMKTYKKLSAYVTIAILAALTAVLDLFGVLGVPFGVVSVSAFYFGAAFYLLFLAGFKTKGVFGIYFGLLLASFATTGFSAMPLILALGNVLAPLFILIFMKVFRCSFELRKVKDIIVEVILLIIAPLISAFWVLGGFVVFNIIPASSFWFSVLGWWLGGVAVYLIIGIPLMKFGLKLLRRFNLN